jgi:4-aminobutyrate aminotransferase-like enzyme
VLGIPIEGLRDLYLGDEMAREDRPQAVRLQENEDETTGLEAKIASCVISFKSSSKVHQRRVAQLVFESQQSSAGFGRAPQD